jgi:hypothetical protein
MDKYTPIDLGEMMDQITSTSSLFFEQAGFGALENATGDYMNTRPE